MPTRYRILGTCDDRTTCEKCGRKGLKKTVALAPLDPDGNPGGAVYFGSDCAGQALMGAKTGRNTGIVADRAAALDYGRRLAARGHAAPVVAAAVRNRFGFMTETRGADVRVGDWGVLTV